MNKFTPEEDLIILQEMQKAQKLHLKNLKLEEEALKAKLKKLTTSAVGLDLTKCRKILTQFTEKVNHVSDAFEFIFHLDNFYEAIVSEVEANAMKVSEKDMLEMAETEKEYKDILVKIDLLERALFKI